MATLIFRCEATHRVIATGIEVNPVLVGNIGTTRLMPCRFCGDSHRWELVDEEPVSAALMSVRAEDYLGRSVQSEAKAAQATDRDIREMHLRLATQWYRLAAEAEATADALR